MPNFSTMPRASQPLDPDPIDTTSPDDSRTSFRTTDFDSILPLINNRFPNIDLVYLTKIFRGTIGANGLIWLDIDRQDTSPLDLSDLAHLMYCFEVYGQIVCIMASPQGMEKELELQTALTDYRLRILKISKWATFDSLRAYHKAFLEAQFQIGQDNAEGWRERREELSGLLRKRAFQGSVRSA